MGKFVKSNTYANQKGHQQVMCKPAKSKLGAIGVTPPFTGGKGPSPTPGNQSGPATSPRSKRPRQAEEATSPGTDTSNGGM